MGTVSFDANGVRRAVVLELIAAANGARIRECRDAGIETDIAGTGVILAAGARRTAHSRFGTSAGAIARRAGGRRQADPTICVVAWIADCRETDGRFHQLIAVLGRALPVLNARFADGATRNAADRRIAERSCQQSQPQGVCSHATHRSPSQKGTIRSWNRRGCTEGYKSLLRPGRPSTRLVVRTTRRYKVVQRRTPSHTCGHRSATHRRR